MVSDKDELLALRSERALAADLSISPMRQKWPAPMRRRLSVPAELAPRALQDCVNYRSRRAVAVAGLDAERA